LRLESSWWEERAGLDNGLVIAFRTGLQMSLCCGLCKGL
jgi:hypothetical protein